jgi:hypothetical protein
MRGDSGEIERAPKPEQAQFSSMTGGRSEKENKEKNWQERGHFFFCGGTSHRTQSIIVWSGHEENAGQHGCGIVTVNVGGPGQSSDGGPGRPWGRRSGSVRWGGKKLDRYIDKYPADQPIRSRC